MNKDKEHIPLFTNIPLMGVYDPKETEELNKNYYLNMNPAPRTYIEEKQVFSTPFERSLDCAEF